RDRTGCVCCNFAWVVNDALSEVAPDFRDVSEAVERTVFVGLFVLSRPSIRLRLAHKSASVVRREPLANDVLPYRQAITPGAAALCVGHLAAPVLFLAFIAEAPALAGCGRAFRRCHAVLRTGGDLRLPRGFDGPPGRGGLPRLARCSFLGRGHGQTLPG